eukprot:TRINITY_DN27580_c0_g1_i1.p1 TRINITY_DN27580_c0_g1~~TRINITY_DN27580_c0_g1_i1.p1  ORF type:complete len:100 (+),score=24.96 TRINITY_DN27580_c0_g1_i1:88-387(+)
MIRRPPRSTLSSSSAASDVYKRQGWYVLGMCRCCVEGRVTRGREERNNNKGSYYDSIVRSKVDVSPVLLSLIHISEPTRLLSISYAVFCLKKKKKTNWQ